MSKPGGRPFLDPLRTLNARGYYVAVVDGRQYRVHRLIWVWVHGSFPKRKYIDHIDGNPLNNRISNLRVVSPSENARNAKLPKDNTSGCVGVWFRKTEKLWYANIYNHDGKQIFVKCSKDINVAIAARKEAEKRYGYHPNHGRVVKYNPT